MRRLDLREDLPVHHRAIVLPPDEGFSVERAAEVSYIYDVPVETLRAWKRRYRSKLGSGKRGAPRKNR
jgi:transposase-like protein